MKRIGGAVGAWFGLLAGVLGAVTLISLISHDWIETVSGVDPDAGSGAVEDLIVVVCFAVSLGCFRLAWVGWRQRAATQD